MPGITNWSKKYVEKTIFESNTVSAQGRQRYVYWENEIILDQYEFIDCTCDEDCWCRENKCTGHYRIKEINFDRFLDSYLKLWIPPTARINIKDGVLHDKPFQGRQRNAIKYLVQLKEKWPERITEVRKNIKCGLCLPIFPDFVKAENLYEGKMWSQLYYDCLVPFDTNSKQRIRKLGYSDPIKDYQSFNKELFSDLRLFSQQEELSILNIRNLDQPWTLDESICHIRNGQPLSRVIDKIFYKPNNRPQGETIV